MSGFSDVGDRMQDAGRHSRVQASGGFPWMLSLESLAGSTHNVGEFYQVLLSVSTVRSSRRHSAILIEERSWNIENRF